MPTFRILSVFPLATDHPISIGGIRSWFPGSIRFQSISSIRIANSLLGGWSVTAIQTVESGLPITFFAGQDVALDGTDENQYAQLVPGANSSTIRISHPNRAAEVAKFFNTEAFVPTSNEPLGNLR